MANMPEWVSKKLELFTGNTGVVDTLRALAEKEREQFMVDIDSLYTLFAKAQTDKEKQNIQEQAQQKLQQFQETIKRISAEAKKVRESLL